MTSGRKFVRGAGFCLAILIAGCAGSAPVDSLPKGSGAPVLATEPETGSAFSEAGLAALEARMAQYVADGQVKGIATRLVRDGQIVSETRAGLRRAGDDAPIEEDTIYRIYSMSKPVTGVALLMLWEEGLFDLEDPVTKFIPEFEGLQVFKGLDEAGAPILEPVNRPPTIQELMSHTAGFGYGLRSGDYVNDAFRAAQIFAAPDLQTMIDRVAAIPLMFEPGETWSYSISVDIQGYLVEKLSGQPFEDFLEERLFTPLGMNDTAFFVPEEEYDRFSDVFVWAGEQAGFVPASDAAFTFRKDTVAFPGGGHGLVSTMNDYARFAEMLVNEGTLDGVKILEPETVRKMAVNVLPEGVFVGHDGISGSNPAGGGFGLNVGVVVNAEAAGVGFPEGAYMWGGAAGTWFWVDPANNLYFIGMVQRFGGGGPEFGARSESGRLVYQALKEKE